MGTRKFDLGIAVALIPILGTGLVLMDQVGRFQFYGVPLEFIEIDAYKILVSSFSMLFLGTAALYAASVFYEKSHQSQPLRLAYHLGFATILTLPFWSGNVHLDRPISWPTVAFIAFTGGVLFGAERWVKHQAGLGMQERVSGWAVVAFFASLLVLTATLAHGYLAERDRSNFTFITGTQDAVVARMGNALIVKTYNPTTKTFVSGVTKFREIGANLSLESRALSPPGQ